MSNYSVAELRIYKHLVLIHHHQKAIWGGKKCQCQKLYKQDLPLMKMYQVENIIIEQSKNRNHDNKKKS